MVLNHRFPLSNINSRIVATARRFQGLARSPPQPIRLRSSINSFNFDYLFGMAGDTFAMELEPAQFHPPLVLPEFCYAPSSSQLTPDSLIETLLANHYGIPASQLLVIQKATRHSLSQQCWSLKWLSGEANSLQYPLSQWVWTCNRFP